ncbi:MAG: hypothetical protein QM703_28175 [Gemmatales bacterium]
MRWRWPLILGLAVGVILYLVLQPRPVAEHRLKAGTPPPSKWMAKQVWKISPSGKHLVFRHDLDSDIRVYDLKQSSLVLEHSCFSGSDYLQFDGKDGLVFADSGKAPHPENTELEVSVLRLWHWSSQEGLRQAGPYQQFLPELPNQVTHSSLHYNGMRKLGQGEFVNGLISPEGLTWLLPRRENGVCRFELIDARTGKLRAPLAKQAISLEDPRLYSFDAVFTKDGSRLVTYDNPLNAQPGGVSFQWWDAQTGALQVSTSYPKASEIGKVLSVERDQVFALNRMKYEICLQSFTIDGGYGEAALDEARLDPKLSNPDPDKWKSSGPIREKETILENGKCIYFRQYVLSQGSKFSNSSGGVWRWSLLDIPSGQTIYQGFWNEPSEQKKLSSNDNDSKQVDTIVAGRHLLVKQFREGQELWKQQLDMWRQRWCPCCRSYFLRHTSSGASTSKQG